MVLVSSGRSQVDSLWSEGLLQQLEKHCRHCPRCAWLLLHSVGHCTALRRLRVFQSRGAPVNVELALFLLFGVFFITRMPMKLAVQVNGGVLVFLFHRRGQSWLTLLLPTLS